MKRNDPLQNTYAAKSAARNITATLLALGRIDFNRDKSVLDVGGGGGGSLLPYMLAGVAAENLAVADADEAAGREIGPRFPGVRFYGCDAERMPMADNSFDLVTASGVLYQITDETKAKRVASEMRRVCRGHILVNDWSLRVPRLQAGRGITKRWCEHIFGAKVLFTLHVQPHAFDRWLRLGPLTASVGRKIYVLKV